MKIPDEIQGVKLNDEQKQTLREGKPPFEGLDLKNTQNKSAYVQLTLTECAESLSDRERRNNYKCRATSR